MSKSILKFPPSETLKLEKMRNVNLSTPNGRAKKSHPFRSDASHNAWKLQLTRICLEFALNLPSLSSANYIVELFFGGGGGLAHEVFHLVSIPRHEQSRSVTFDDRIRSLSQIAIYAAEA